MNKILIIDDDRELCALIKRSVQSEHIEADFCNTGKEGLQKLKEQEYQLEMCIRDSQKIRDQLCFEKR